jgi:hypothetical protein
MKKILLGLLLLIIIALAAVYMIIPGKLNMNGTVTINAALPGVFRTLTNDSSWEKWWPGNPTFNFNGKKFMPGEKLYNSIEIIISDDETKLNSRMDLLLIKTDMMTIEWHAEQINSKNPFKRFSLYMQAASIQEDMHSILAALKNFMENPKNIYGLDIKETFVKDSALITTRRQFDHYPGTQEVDLMIQRLKKYISQNNAIEKNLPMLNVFELGSSKYEAMTAIPVDKALPKTNEFAPKFLLKGGNILEAQVEGGPHTIEKSLKELENYRADFKLYSPAIPYQVLVTDRAKEPDTIKWITRLYYPIY